MSKKINNQGFSLVELIVVMVVMVILATATVLAFVNSNDQRVKASTSLVTKYLDNSFSYAMSKGNSYFTLRYDAKSDRYYVEDTEGHSERLSNGITVQYDIANGSTGVGFDKANDRLMFSFNRNNGSYTPIIVSVADDGTFTYMSSGGVNLYASKITITSGDYSKVIDLYPKTGEYKVEE